MTYITAGRPMGVRRLPRLPCACPAALRLPHPACLAPTAPGTLTLPARPLLPARSAAMRRPTAWAATSL